MIKVFYFAPENSGVAYYRFYQPLEELKEKGLIELRSWGFDFTDERKELPRIKELKEIAEWGDVFIFGRLDSVLYFNVIQTIKEFSGKPVILDIDDNIYSITPYLPAYIGYNPNGEARKLHEKIAKYVDLIIVSTPALEEIYKSKNNVMVVENGVKNIYPKKSHQEIRMGYLVSNSHLENAQLVEDTIIKILLKYTNVRFYYTKAFGGFLERVPEQIKNQINYLPFYPIKDYLKYVNNLGLDIGIAPLMNNDFNRCKSNIRILEYWQNQIAVVASPLDEYKKTITHGLDGYLAEDDEWANWLSDLIEKPELRQYFVKNSLDTIKKFDISIFANKYYEVLKEMIGEK